VGTPNWLYPRRLGWCEGAALPRYYDHDKTLRIGTALIEGMLGGEGEEKCSCDYSPPGGTLGMGVGKEVK